MTLSLIAIIFSNKKKMKLVVTQFSEYTIVWWDQMVVSRRRNLEEPINSWTTLKTIMRRRFIPRHYHRELYQRLQILRQGTKSIEDYHKEMEMLMTRLD